MFTPAVEADLEAVRAEVQEALTRLEADFPNAVIFEEVMSLDES